MIIRKFKIRKDAPLITYLQEAEHEIEGVSDENLAELENEICEALRLLLLSS